MSGLYGPRAHPAWPDRDPAPWVTNLEETDGAPDWRTVTQVTALVDLLHGAGWEVRVGYCAGLRRAPKTGTYRPVEALGVQALGPDGYRAWATLRRYSNAGHVVTHWSDGESRDAFEGPDAPGKWSWDGVRLTRNLSLWPMTITRLKAEIGRISRGMRS